MDKKRKVILIILSIIIVFCLGFLIYSLVKKETKENNFTVVGEITYITTNNLTIKDEEGLYYSISYSDSNSFSLGDKISVYTEEPIIETYPPQIVGTKITILEKVTEQNNEESNEEEKEEEQPSNNNSSSNNSNTNNQSSNSNTNSNNNSSSNNVTPKYIEEDVVTYFRVLDDNTSNKNASTNLLGSIKKGFVTVVDFLFYGEKIYGYTFNELTNKAKLTVIKLGLSIDSKIDTLIPGYKETITSTAGRVYNNIKGKIVALYLDVTTTICTNDPATCEQAKSDFQDLKKSFSLTWDLVKDLASTGVGKLSSWYQIWRYE